MNRASSGQRISLCTNQPIRTPTGSAAVARLGYAGWQANRRVAISGARNVILARLVPFLPRRTVLGIVHNPQSQA